MRAKILLELQTGMQKLAPNTSAMKTLMMYKGKVNFAVLSYFPQKQPPRCVGSTIAAPATSPV